MTLNFKQSLIKQLSTATLTTQLGSTAVYMNIIPEGKALPAVTVARISETSVHASIADAPVKTTLVQISAWSTSLAQVENIAAKIDSVLKDFSGKLGGNDGILVQRAFLENTVDLYDIDRLTNMRNERITWQIAKDFLIWYTT